MIDETAKKFFNDIRNAADGAKEAFLGDNKRSSENPNESSERPEGSPHIQAASHLKAFVESGLKRMNLVSREEFDTQQAVLARTREKLDALEVVVQELESKISNQ